MSLDIIDGLSVAKTLKTTLDGSDHLTHHVSKGGVADNAPETESPIPVAGKAVTSASYAPVYTDADRAILAIDKTSGGLLCHTRQLTASTDVATVVGDIAHDGVDTGSGPVKLGGLANSTVATPVAVANGDRVAAWFDVSGRLMIQNSVVEAFTHLASAARTATPGAGAVIRHFAAKGITVFLNVTAIGAAPSITVSIEAIDPINLTTGVALLTSAAITGVGLTRLVVYPGLLAAANLRANDVLPKTFRFNFTHANADSITYSVSYCFQA